MDIQFLFYYKLVNLNLHDFFKDIKIESIKKYNYKDVSCKLVKFNKTSLDDILSIINNKRNIIKIKNNNKYDIKNMMIKNIGNVYIILPKNV